MKKITIIDYNISNIFSIKNAVNYLGFKADISNKIKNIESSDIIILPGVGSFPNAMKKLNDLKITKIIQNSKSNKKIIGICLGMQLLFEESFEFKKTTGLGLFKGSIVNLQKDKVIPNVGWQNVLFKKSNNNNYYKYYNNKNFYFVHSYYANNFEKNNLVLYSKYKKKIIPAFVREKNIYAFQFHPEKSGEIGLNLLEEVLKQ